VAICLIFRVPGGTLAQYDAVRDALGNDLEDGQISHVAGSVAGDLCVVDTWESRADFDRFMQEKLGEQMGAAGVPEPQITEFEIHNSVQRG
jgi:hypothetical protein